MLRMTGEVPSNGKLSTLVVTNGIKLGGLYLAVREGVQETVSPSVLALAAFMMAGAQGLENFLLRFLDRDGK